jgi:poly-beta-1,6-N-acetyl-D-glucosamine synthase
MTTRLLVVTPARNEVEHLPYLIAGVRAQTRLPDRWIIVDDGSTDGTADLVRELCADLPWVTLIERDGAVRRADASKAKAVNAAIHEATTDDTEVIVTFDADVVPPVDYLHTVEAAYDADPELGIYGGVYTYLAIRNVRPEPFPPDVVPGGVTTIRRAAYDEIGGYMALPFGGIDTSACIAVQLHGWKSVCDPALVCEHRRQLGTGEGRSARRDMYRRGREDYDLGAPLWFELGKCVRWLPRRPFVVGGVWMAAGFVRSMLTRTPHTPSAAFVDFNRRRARARVARRVRGLVAR